MQNKSQASGSSAPFKLLKSFSGKELINFEKLMDSGYLGTKEDLRVLIKSLKKHALHHTNFAPEIQCIIYKTLYKEEPIKETLNKSQRSKLNRVMNDLLRLAEKFLMFESIKHTNEHDASLLFPELINRKQLKRYSMRIKATEAQLSKEKKQGVDYHNQCYSIQHEKARLLFMNNVLPKEDNYDVLQYHADIKYLLQKLQYHLAKITIQRRYVYKTFNHKPFVALQALLKLPEYESNPLIKLYVLNLKLLETDEEATFISLSRLLKEKQEVIPADFLKPFYINLTNYCIYQVSRGNLNYFNYMFNIYNDMHEANLLVTNNSIELALLKNLITNACRIKAFDWAVDKLLYYIKYVPAEIRNTVFEYNSGIIAFNQQKYEAALNHFTKVRKIDDTHELSLRITQLQCFYEIDVTYENYTQQLIESLKTFFHQNKKLSKQRKTGYFNFIRVFSKLYKLKNILDKHSRKTAIKKDLPKLKARLLEFDIILLKQWLLSKIESLESSF